MNDRTVAFIGSGVTVLALIIFWNGLLRGFAVTRPDSTTGQAIVKLIG